MSKKLSHSAVSMYSACGRKYKLWYLDRIRPDYTSGALLFGNALDKALNHLLEHRKLDDAKALFKKCFSYTNINGENVYVPYSRNVVYSKKDFDKDLITPEQSSKYNEVLGKHNIATEGIVADYEAVSKKKSSEGLKSLTGDERFKYALTNFLSLLAKGQYILDSYAKKVLPKIKTVHFVQRVVNCDLGNGKKLYGYIDLVATLDDGKTYILDHKTTSMEYASDAASRSQQLIAYFHALKSEIHLDGVGFVPIYKQLNKNRVKICSLCKFDGSGSRHKTCSNTLEGVRCNGEWTETVSPEARIEFILDTVNPVSETLVVDTFRETSEGIDKGVFSPNLAACKVNDDYFCPFINLCWKNKMDDLVILKKEDEGNKKT